MTVGTLGRTPLRLAAVNEAIKYARTVRPSVAMPDLDADGLSFVWQVSMHLHWVALDALHAAPAVNDDLPWEAVRQCCDEQRGYAYSTATLDLPHARLTLYSEHIALDEAGHPTPRRGLSDAVV